MSSLVTLRPVQPQDLPTLFSHQRDCEAAEMAAFTPRDEVSFFEHWNRLLANPSNLARTVLLADTVAGYIGSFPQGPGRMVGYWIARELWGKGVATAALRRFTELDSFRPLRACVAEHNVGSIRVLQKAGFVPVGKESSTFDDQPLTELIFELPA